MAAATREESLAASGSSRRRAAHLGIELAAILCLVAAPSRAELYRVELVGGAPFETRYWPRADGEGRVLLLTDVGNWIVLPGERVLRVVVDSEERGFGRAIDGQTLLLGRTLNDRDAVAGGREPASPMEILARLFERRFEALPNFTVDQFVEPEETEGIPLGYTLQPLPPPGAPERFVTDQDRP